MVTNGFAWTPKKIAAAKAAGLTAITVSLDGPPGEHDWLRGRDGSHRRAVQTIRWLLEDRFWRTMDVITVVHPRNLDHLEVVRQTLIGLGVPAWRLVTVFPVGRAADDPDLLLDAAQYRRLLRFIEGSRAAGGIRVRLSESDYVGCYDLRVRDHYYFCRAGVTTAGVMVNGDIAACPNIDRRLAQGNVFRDSFVQTWEEKYQAFRERDWMRRGDCEDCGEWRYCRGGPMHLWDVEREQTRLCHCRAYGLGAPEA